jgi:hypothetical protein
MALTPADAQVVSVLADVLYDFLPGKPHPRANPRISFPGAAFVVGVGDLWTEGSKHPSIVMLLRRTLETRRDRFCRLITEIVTTAMVYRGNKSPLTRGEVEKVNAAVQRLGFKIPELWDSAFLSSLAQPADTAPKPAENLAVPATTIAELKQTLLHIMSLAPHERGFAFERFLNDLFAAYKLAPHGSYRLRGEQIDGSFEHDRDFYLVEAKWQAQKVGVSELRSFRGAVDSKAEWSRGCYISYSGFSSDGLVAFSHGASVRIVCVDAEDLFHVVDGRIDLRDLIRAKVRYAAERGVAFVRARELFLDVI